MDANVASAAADTLSWITRHIEKAEPDVRKLLVTIQCNLFDAEFSATDLEIEEPVYKTLSAFRATTGFNPRDYVAIARAMIAVRLLCETSLRHQVLAELVGLQDKKALSKTCRRFFGCTPGELRAAANAARLAGRRPFPSLGDYQCWRRGELGSEKVEEMAERLDQIERELGQSTGSGRPLVKLGVTEAVLGLQLSALLSYPRATRLRLVREGVYRGSEEAFEAISSLSRKQGRRDRQKGIDLAEIALAAVEGCAAELEEKGADYLALGWARLGNARRLASDLEGAERAIREAESWAESAVESDRIQAELLRFKGSLRLYQRRFAEALALTNEAVTFSQLASDRLLLIDALHQRAGIHLYRAEPTEAMPDLDRAHHLLDPEDKRRQMGSLQLLLEAAVLAEDKARASELLPEVRRLSREIGHRPCALQAQWLEGWLLREAGDLEAAASVLKEARAGFANIQDMGMMAVCSLDLALLYHQQAGPGDLIKTFAADALPAFEELKIPEAHGAFALLREAIRDQKIHRSILQLAHRCLLGFRRS